MPNFGWVWYLTPDGNGKCCKHDIDCLPGNGKFWPHVGHRNGNFPDNSLGLHIDRVLVRSPVRPFGRPKSCESWAWRKSGSARGSVSRVKGEGNPILFFKISATQSATYDPCVRTEVQALPAELMAIWRWDEGWGIGVYLVQARCAMRMLMMGPSILLLLLILCTYALIG